MNRFFNNLVRLIFRINMMTLQMLLKFTQEKQLKVQNHFYQTISI